MADFLEATDAPTVWKSGDKEYIFPVWETAQWIPVLAVLMQKRMDSFAKYLKQANVKPAEAAYHMMQEECRIPDANDAHAYSLTLEGMDRVMKDSLVRSGVNAMEATAIVNAIPTRNKYKMVLNVAGVFEPRKSTAGTTTTANSSGSGFGDSNQSSPSEPPTFGGSQSATPNPPGEPFP